MSSWGITRFLGNEIISCENVNSRIGEVNALFPVPISKGGTGATSAAQARANLGLETYTLLFQNVSGTSGTITLPALAASCSRWGVYYGINNIGGYQECDPSDTPTIDIYATYMSVNDNMYVRSALMYFNKSSRTISMARNSTFIVHANGNHSTTDDALKIYNVVGYI